MQDAQLRDALVEVLEDINTQIELIGDKAVNLGCQPYEVMNMNGDYLINPLLVAKSQVLAAMAYMSPRNSFVVYNNAGYSDAVAAKNSEAFAAEAERPLFDGSTPEDHRGHGCSVDPATHP